MCGQNCWTHIGKDCWTEKGDLGALLSNHSKNYVVYIIIVHF